MSLRSPCKDRASIKRRYSHGSGVHSSQPGSVKATGCSLPQLNNFFMAIACDIELTIIIPVVYTCLALHKKRCLHRATSQKSPLVDYLYGRVLISRTCIM